DARAASLWTESADLFLAAYGQQAATLGHQIRRFEFDKALATLETLVHDQPSPAR
ncbi:MAG: hypothetical protein JNM97_20450, partial [Rhodoferax sp.]|nr:hypothetical protein [Rhodoferax sp.]